MRSFKPLWSSIGLCLSLTCCSVTEDHQPPGPLVQPAPWAKSTLETYQEGSFQTVLDTLPVPDASATNAMLWEHHLDRAMTRLARGDSLGAQMEFEQAVDWMQRLGHDAQRGDPEALLRHFGEGIAQMTVDDRSGPYVAAHHEHILANIMVALLRLVRHEQGAAGYAENALHVALDFEAAARSQGLDPSSIRPTGLADFVLAVLAEDERSFATNKALQHYERAAQLEGEDVAGIHPHLQRLQTLETEPTGSPVWVFVLDAPTLVKRAGFMRPGPEIQALIAAAVLPTARQYPNSSSNFQQSLAHAYPVPALEPWEGAVGPISLTIDEGALGESLVGELPTVARLDRASAQSFALTAHAACTRAAIRHFAASCTKASIFGIVEKNGGQVVRDLFGSVHQGLTSHVETAADLRGWTLLPGSVRAQRLTLEPGVHELALGTRAARSTATIQVPHGGRPTYVLAVAASDAVCGQLIVSDPVEETPPLDITARR